jgi:hypothetical protein
MKIYLTFLAVIFSTILVAQEGTMENEKLVKPDFILQEFSNLEIKTFNYEGEPEIRHYGIDNSMLFDAFGTDGEGTISSKNSFSKDELLYISLAAIKGLRENNEKLNQTVLDLETELMHMKNMLEIRENPTNEIEELKSKIEELNNKIETQNNNVKLNQNVLDLENELMRFRDMLETREDPTEEIDLLRIKVEELNNKLETQENN